MPWAKVACYIRSELDPIDYDLLGLHHAAYYVDTCLPFGYRNGSALFDSLSDAVCHIMRQCNFDIINYIDNILGRDVPSKIDAFLTLWIIF